jgi:hypothetical protein
MALIVAAEPVIGVIRVLVQVTPSVVDETLPLVSVPGPFDPK